ncbi:patatin-like protein [Virgisporangium aurantiacum]|uniref:PNPLA domain-containing protein n=1 Tax=Virgisporangium aurantiacum TaxID=175570 RepID=A0A8J3ZNX0_9ACTN|nr:patatin-like protein [Virgisporangium aurantiacum]GIJ64895.1 hypothetical protein Vau01_124110 [Virgisporangium aurantiacum]
MTSDVPVEEIRFAVVLNGGVSLAVWMGGAVLEIDRLSRGEGPYGALLDLVGGTARADVITGTSAGGINGAALALAQVNAGADLRQLRDLWAQQGDIDALMRRPFQGAPVSLLRGDEYFLPQLQTAFQRLASPYRKRPPEERPVDLTITTTLLHGARVMHVDALGQNLPQSLHDGRFRFRHDSPQSVPPGHAASTDFDCEHLNETVARLALAARSTASFPLAFEPSYVPVAEQLPRPDDTRPDMHSVASWANGRTTDRSRFVVDGGLLANTPTREALEAVDRMPAEGPVRRVMLLIYPHAMANVADDPDRPEDVPTVLETPALLIGALSSQGSRTHVEEIDRHNKAAASRRAGRFDLMDSLTTGNQTIYQTANHLYPLYERLRERRAARDLAGRVPAAENWPYERIRVCAERAQESERGNLPYLPGEPAVDAAVHIRTWSDGWAWGITTAEHLAESSLDLLSRLVWVVSGEDGVVLSAQRKTLFEARLAIRQLREKVDRPWVTEPRLADRAPDQGYWHDRLDVYRRKMLRPIPPSSPDEGAIGECVREQVTMIAECVAATLPHLRNLDAHRLELGRLRPWKDLLTEPPVAEENDAGIGDDTTRVLARLLALEILTTCLAEETETGMSQPVELVQVSLMTHNPFARYAVTPADKGAGMALSRFAGFLKQSWRINDWMWGRLDASATLCRILLNPERLRRIAILNGTLTARTPRENAEAVVNTVTAMFRGTPLPQQAGPLVAEAVEQLLEVYADTLPPNGLPTSLPALADLAAWAVQADIAAEELPALADAARADRDDGGNPRARGVQFLNLNEQLLTDLRTATDPTERVKLGLAALKAFDKAGIGHEALHEEATSDRLIRTTVEAASVAVTVVDSDRSGLPVLKPVTRTLRGLALLPYWAIRGVTSGSGIAKFLALLGFSVGGLLVVLALLGTLPAWASGPAAAAGAGALLGTFAYGALRTGTFLHGIVLSAPVVPLVVFAMTAVGTEGAKATRGASALVLVLIAVASLIILGSLPASPPSPVIVVRRGGTYVWRYRNRYLAGLAILLMFGGLAWIVVGLIAPAFSSWVRTSTAVERTGWAIGITAFVLLVMTMLAWWLGRHLGMWVHLPTGYQYRYTVHPAGSAAGWSIIYAVFFIAVAVVLARWGKAGTWQATEPWMVSAFITAVMLAAVLLLVVPWFAPWRACVRLSERVILEATAEVYRVDPANGPATVEDMLIARLQFTGLAYRYFLCLGKGKKDLALTLAGRRVCKRIKRKLQLVDVGPHPDQVATEPAASRAP